MSPGPQVAICPHCLKRAGAGAQRRRGCCRDCYEATGGGSRRRAASRAQRAWRAGRLERYRAKLQRQQRGSNG